MVWYMQNNVSEYKQVAVKASDGEYNVLSISEWMGINIGKRLELIKDGKVTFLSDKRE